MSTPSLFSATLSSTAMSLTQTSSNLLSQSIMWRAQQYWWALQKYSDISWLTSVKAQRHEESSENILLQKGELVIKQNSPQVCTSMAAPWNVMAQLEKWLGVLQVVSKSKIYFWYPIIFWYLWSLWLLATRINLAQKQTRLPIRMIFSTQDHLDTLPLSADRVRELRAGFYLNFFNLLSFSVSKKLEDNF